MRMVVAFLVGILFSFGLLFGQMTNPAVVRGFLDFFGDWNPALAFVLGGAVSVSILAWRLRLKCSEAAFGGALPNPPSHVIDTPLVSGAIMFGVGWGLVGLCPGPALTGLTIGGESVWVFFVAMLAGMGLYNEVHNR